LFLNEKSGIKKYSSYLLRSCFAPQLKIGGALIYSQKIAAGSKFNLSSVLPFDPNQIWHIFA
jgi:hypothetical protein